MRFITLFHTLLCKAALFCCKTANSPNFLYTHRKVALKQYRRYFFMTLLQRFCMFLRYRTAIPFCRLKLNKLGTPNFRCTHHQVALNNIGGIFHDVASTFSHVFSCRTAIPFCRLKLNKLGTPNFRCTHHQVALNNIDGIFSLRYFNVFVCFCVIALQYRFAV